MIKQPNLSLSRSLFFVFCISTLFLSVSTAQAATDLVPNGDLDTVASDTVRPESWWQGGWGDNTRTHLYPVAGRNGGNAARVEVSNYVSGDAKWFFEEVSVTAGNTYVFSDQYKTSAQGTVFVRYNSGSCAVSGVGCQYEQIGSLGAVSDWTPFQAQFVVPVGVNSVTVFHAIAGNGFLIIDDVSLTKEAPLPITDAIPNNSLETVDETNQNLPKGWQTNQWGTNNPSFEYISGDASDGDRSVKVTMSGYVSGDAKWVYPSQPIIGGESYVFTAGYKTNITPAVVMQYTLANGAVSYEGLPEPGATGGVWQVYQGTFTAPADAVSARVFFVIYQNGWLFVDDYHLTPHETATVVDGIPNNSVQRKDDLDQSVPSNWRGSSWGQNSPIYEYVLDDGHNSTRSVKVTMNNYVSGDAKWVYEAQPVIGGENYFFTGWYKGNVTPHVVAEYVDVNGNYSYYGLPRPAAATQNWQRYQNEISVPENVVTMTVFFYLNENGWLQTDDYHLTSYEYVGFDRPIVSITFDDGAEENVTSALPIMQQYGFVSTQCYATDHVEGVPEQVERVLAFYNAGHEVCSHSVNHPDLTTLSQAELEYELGHSQEYLESVIGEAVPNFASPYGAYNSDVIETIKQYYGSHRSVDEGFNSKDNLDPYRLKVQNMLSGTTLEEVQEWVNKAIETNTWLILVYHRVSEANVGPYDTYTSDFAEQMEWLVSSGVAVERYDVALAEVLAQ